MNAPHWPLRGVKKAVTEGRIQLTESRAVNPLICDAPGVQNRMGAMNYAKAAILDLNGTDFSHCLPGMADFCDVYGVERDGKHWWVKITMMETPGQTSSEAKAGARGKKKAKQVLVISFHKPEQPFKTVGGKELRPW